MLGSVGEILFGPHGRALSYYKRNIGHMADGHMTKMCPLIAKEMLFGLRGINALLVLQDKCYFGHMTEMCPHVTKQMLFESHGTNVLLVLQEKYYFGNTA